MTEALKISEFVSYLIVQPLHLGDSPDLSMAYQLLFVREGWGEIKRLDECRRHKSIC